MSMSARAAHLLRVRADLRTVATVGMRDVHRQAVQMPDAQLS